MQTHLVLFDQPTHSSFSQPTVNITYPSLEVEECYQTKYLLIYLSRYLDQEITKWLFRSSSQAATCLTTQSRVVLLSALPKDITQVNVSYV